MDRARVLVLGSSGQVGRQLAAHLRGEPSRVDLVEANRSADSRELAFRLEDPPSVEAVIRLVEPRHTFLVAAATNVAWCEAHPVESSTVNVDGSAVVARACRLVGSTLAFISTDYVFDESTAPSGEKDNVHPLNEYGRQKLAAERIIVDTHPSNLVVRTCQVFGADERRANFVVRTIDRLRAGETVPAAGDMYGTPTYAGDLARTLVDLVLRGQRGIWHAAGESYVSRYELAMAAAVAFGVAHPAILEVSADSLDDGVARPRRAGLRNDRLHAEVHASMTPLADALAAVAEWYKRQ